VGLVCAGDETNPNQIDVGDALDFWRVLYANKKEGRLLLFAEMKSAGRGLARI
jgi:hypothetical protein